MDSEVQRRYFQLRSQLQGLNYSCNFGLDALDVVQELFTDLVSTTESYTLLQDKESKLSHDLAIAQTHLLPLRKEIGRLTKENHHFHLDNIRIKEESVEEIGKIMSESQKAHLDATELRHIVYLKDRELQQAEEQRQRLRQAYEELAAVSLSGGATKVKRAVKSTSTLPANGNNTLNGNKRGKDLYAQLQQAVENGSSDGSVTADRILMDKMRAQIESLTAALARSQDTNRSLETAVRRREHELGKELQKVTSRSLEGGIHESEGKMEMLVMADSANARIIDQLNGQVDFLNDQLATREAQLASLSEKLLGAQELRLECDNRGKLLDASREENAMLIAELRELEDKIEEFNHYTDPEGGMSIQSLSQGSSLGPNDPSSGGHLHPSPLSTPSPKANARSPGSGRAVEKLRDEKEGLIGEVGSLNSRINELSSEENMLRTRLVRAEGRIDELKALLQRTNEESERTSSQLASRTSEATELRNELNDAKMALQLAQESLAEKNEKLSSYESMNKGVHSVARLEKEKTYLEETLTSLNNELSSARKDKFQLELRYEELLHGEVRTLRVDCSSLSETVESLTNELTELRGKTMSLEAENAHSNDELQSERTRAARLQRQCDDLEHKYRDTSTELTKAMSSIVQLQGVIRHLQSDEEVLSTQYNANHMSIISAMSTSSPGEVSTDSNGAPLISPSVRGKAAEMAGLRKQLADERALCEKLSDELGLVQKEGVATHQQLVATSARLQAMEADYRSATQLLEGRETELVKTQSALSASKAEEHKLRRELENSKAVYNALTTSDDERLTKIEILTSELDRLSSENRLLSRRSEEATMALKDHEHRSSEASSVASSAISRVATAERAAEAAQGLLREKQRELGAFQSRLLDLEQRLEQTGAALEKSRAERDGLIGERDALQSKVSELKSVISSLDSSSRDGALRMTRISGQSEEVRQALLRSEGKCAELTRHVQERDDKIASLTQSLQRLDEERDDLQNQLDSIAEQRTASEDVKDKAQRDVSVLSSRLQECEARLSITTEEVTVARRHCAVAEGRIASLKSELEEANRRFNMSHAEVAGAAEDLQLMTRENQAITSELAEVSFERDRLRERVGELSAVASNLEQARRGVEIERSDLLVAYRTALQQKRRLETDLATMATLKQRMATSLQQMHSDTAELRAQLSDKVSHLDREAYDRAALVSQIEALNSQLVSSAQSAEGVEADNRRLIQENYTLTQANQMLHERITMLLKRATSASDSNKVLATRLAGVERERDAMRAVASIEKQRAADLGSVVELSRAQAATATAQVDRYRQALVSTSSSRGELHTSEKSSAVTAEEKSRTTTITRTSTVVSSSQQHSSVNTVESEAVTARVNDALLDSVLGHGAEDSGVESDGSDLDTQ